MISEVVMPQMGADMTEGTLVKWLKAEGDPVERGEIIAEIETDKANVEIEAFESGVFRKALASEGDTVEVGGLIGIIAAADEDISAYASGTGTSTKSAPAPGAAAQDLPATSTRPTADAPSKAEARMETGAGAEAASDRSPAAVPASADESAPVIAPSSLAGTRVRVSPVARRMAVEAGIDLGTITGSGPDGRIIKRDIEGAATRGQSRGRVAAAAKGATAKKPSKMRQAIARRMSQSKRESPHYYLLLDIDMTSALDIRAQYNTGLAGGDVNGPAGTKVSINDMLVRAAALALRKHPEFNTTIDSEGATTSHEKQNICIGIALEEGLIAPAILDAAAKSLAEIAAASTDLIARSKGGALRPAEINDGTFTITNLGGYGVETLIGIIQPPQTAILGVGTITAQPVVRDGQIEARQVMKVALSADHRATDGAQGAQFLSELKRLLENPILLVA